MINQEQIRIKEIESRTVGLINNHRLAMGMNALQVHPLLKDKSKMHADNMAYGETDFGHYGFKRRYRELKKVLAVIGYGENLAYNRAEDPGTKAFCQWMTSPTHKLNLEKKTYTHCGLSVSSAKNGFFYFTHILVSIPAQS